MPVSRTVRRTTPTSSPAPRVLGLAASRDGDDRAVADRWTPRVTRRTPDSRARTGRRHRRVLIAGALALLAAPAAASAASLADGGPIDLLTEAGVPRDSIRSYRAGNFGASNLTWRAMAGAGLTLSSNYNPCYFDLHCAMRSDKALAGLFPTEVDGVWELPITNFRQPNGGHRHLQAGVARSARFLRP